MIDKATDDFFTNRHARLMTISRIANIAAWAILIFNIFGLIVGFIQDQPMLSPNALLNFQQSGLWVVIQNIWISLTQNQLTGARLIFNLLKSFLEGVGAFLLLKGLSLGLRMIVETDLNYKEKNQQGGREQ